MNSFEDTHQLHASAGRFPDMAYIDVVRGADLRSSEATRGIVRDAAFERRGMTIARSRVPAGVSSDWHHHGERELYGFMVSGRLRLEYGPLGKQAADLSPGDFFHIPARLVHRDVNPTRDQDVIVVNLLEGVGPTVVNVSGPGG